MILRLITKKLWTHNTSDGKMQKLDMTTYIILNHFSDYLLELFLLLL